MNKGFPSESKLGEQKYNTITPMGSDKNGMDMAPKALFPITGASDAIVSAPQIIDSTGSTLRQTQQRVEITGHGLRIGDALRFDSGPLTSIEAPVVEIIDANFVVIPFKIIEADAIASTAILMRYVTLTLDASGSLVTTSGPLQYILDGGNQTVIEDTAVAANNRSLPIAPFFKIDGVSTPVNVDTATPANDRAIPSAMYIERDGAYQKIIKDTATPANTRAMPVELVSTTGVEATINVTTGDLGVEISHDGATHVWDSTRIGDGTNLMAVNASLEATVRDADSIAELQTLVTSNAAILVDTSSIDAKQSTIATNTGATATSVASIDTKMDSLIANSSVSDVTENYYKRDFTGSPLATASGFVTLRTLTASIKKLSIINNSGNELVLRNATSGIQVVVGQGGSFDIAMVGIATDVIEISAITADAVDGIIYVNFEG